MSVHQTALIAAGAELGDDVEVGPYAVIGPQVVLAAGVKVGPHCVIEGETTVGAGTVLHAHVALGGPPQDRKHDPSVPTRLLIGERNVMREFFTAHTGSSHGNRETVIGSGGYFMANSHVAHDAVVGDDVMFANSAAIGGHTVISDGAVLGGLCAIHQFCRVGRLAMLGGGAMCAQDVPPFMIAQGDRARIYGLNIIGLGRAGIAPEAVSALKEAFRVLFTEGLPRRTATQRVRESVGAFAEVAELLAFIEESERGVCRAGLKP